MGAFVLDLAEGVREGSPIRLRVEKVGYKIYDKTVPASSRIPLGVSLESEPRRKMSRTVTGIPPVGVLVTSISMLNVGGSPAATQVANPPDWREPTTIMHLRFTDSPLLTAAVQRQIATDLSAFREYLQGLELPAAEDFPTIGTSDRPGSAQSRTWGSLPEYRSSATINQGWILDRRAVTEQYVDYAVGQMLRIRLAQHPSASGLLQDMMVASAVAPYYNWSFWNYKADNVGGYWSSQLWDIRRAMGKQFTDRLIGFVLKAIIDSPEDGADPHFDIYFYRKIQAADSVIDNNAAKMAEITAIIEKSGIDVTTPKAHLEFSATAHKRHDLSYEIDAVATNASDVPTGRGELSVTFAPDVRLLQVPEGTRKNPSTTLQAARLIPFGPIRAHGKLRVKLVFTPIRESFPADMEFFVLDFGYQCESCGRDSYDHSLKFMLDSFGSGK
jgi:hypothetical protein